MGQRPPAEERYKIFSARVVTDKFAGSLDSDCKNVLAVAAGEGSVKVYGAGRQLHRIAVRPAPPVRLLFHSPKIGRSLAIGLKQKIATVRRPLTAASNLRTRPVEAQLVEVVAIH